MFLIFIIVDIISYGLDVISFSITKYVQNFIILLLDSLFPITINLKLSNMLLVNLVLSSFYIIIIILEDFTTYFITRHICLHNNILFYNLLLLFLGLQYYAISSMGILKVLPTLSLEIRIVYRLQWLWMNLYLEDVKLR